MTIYEFPSQEGAPKEKKVQEPEIIIIDEEETSENYQRIHPQQVVKIPFYVRLVSFLVGIFASFWASVFFVLTLICIALAALTFFKFPSFTLRIKPLWIATKFATVLAIGLLIAAFSPSLGFVLILTYMVMLDDKWKHSSFTRKMRSHIEPYME